MKKVFLLICFLGIMCLAGKATAGEIDSLKNVIYGKARGYDQSWKTLNMDIYFPQKAEGAKYPLVLVMHGGGFISGSKEAMKMHCRQLADSGFIAVTINYRKGWDRGTGALSCEGDVKTLELAIYRATQDARAAMRYLVDKQKDYAIDTTRMFAAGSSAGGVMALNLAYMTNIWAEKHLKAATEQLGKLDEAVNEYKHSFTLKGICSMWGALPDSSMITTQNALPTILYHGTNDLVIPSNVGRYGTMCQSYPVVYGSECVYRQTVAAGKPAILNLANGAGHGPRQFLSKNTVGDNASFFKKIITGKAATHQILITNKSHQ